VVGGAADAAVAYLVGQSDVSFVEKGGCGRVRRVGSMVNGGLKGRGK
jgi:hypothetical protein